MLPWSFIQRSPPDYQQMLNQKMQQPYPYYDQLQQLNIPGMG